MRISDWSSDVCSSDLVEEGVVEAVEIGAAIPGPAPAVAIGPADQVVHHFLAAGIDMIAHVDDEIGLRGIGRRAIAFANQIGRPELCILAEFDPVLEPRSEKSRVGKEWVRTCRSRWTAYP